MNIIDFIVLGLIAIIAVASAKKGFLMSLFNVVAYVISGFFSKLFCNPVTEYVYEYYMQEKVLMKLNELLPSGSVDGEISTVIDNTLNSLPVFFTGMAEVFGIYDVSGSAAINTEAALTVEVIESDYIGPIVLNIISVVVLVLLFVFFSMLFRFILSFVNRTLTKKKHKLIRGTNMFLGAAIGVIKGIIPAGILCALVNIAAPVLNNELLYQYASDSYFCNLVADLLK
jgi:uncharacterized membrane protein required for colicin V production